MDELLYKPRTGKFFWRGSSTKLHELHPDDGRALCGVELGPTCRKETMGLPSLMCQRCFRLGEWEAERGS